MALKVFQEWLSFQTHNRFLSPRSSVSLTSSSTERIRIWAHVLIWWSSQGRNWICTLIRRSPYLEGHKFQLRLNSTVQEIPPVTQPARKVLTDSRLRLTSLALASPLSTETYKEPSIISRSYYSSEQSSDHLPLSLLYYQNDQQSSFMDKLALAQAKESETTCSQILSRNNNQSVSQSCTVQSQNITNTLTVKNAGIAILRDSQTGFWSKKFSVPLTT